MEPAHPDTESGHITCVASLENSGLVLICKDSMATERLGQIIGSLAKNGDVFCFSGDLGAGKTLMSRGISLAQGVLEEDVNSPTFAIMNVYQGKNMEIRHFDLYRLNSPDELTDIGFYEYAGGEGITLIEWADLFTSELPPEYLQISINIVSEGRRVELMPQGQRYEQLCEEVQNLC